MSALKVRFTDFARDLQAARLAAFLQQRFDLKTDANDPDFVIFSVFGDEYLEYPDAVRIFFTTENIHPDFNFCDYAFGFDWMSFGDRYYRFPNYQLHKQFKELCQRKRSMLDPKQIPAQKQKFCNFIFSNGRAHPFRDEFFHLLGRYRKVDSAGGHLNNMGPVRGPSHQGDWSAGKVQFQQAYKFSIAFENSSSPGYTTEKIVHALAADTIPIYWGNPEVGREFNSRRIINCHEYSSPAEVINRVREVDQNDALFASILAEPFFPSDEVPGYLQDAGLLKHFDVIFSQGKEKALRRNRYGIGGAHEERRLSKMRMGMVKTEIERITPSGARIILVDDEQLESDVVSGRIAIPFLERDGQYWGLPDDDQHAIGELERLRRDGCSFIVVAWPSFWWMDSYSGFFSHLREGYPCLLENRRLIAFDLRKLN